MSKREDAVSEGLRSIAANIRKLRLKRVWTQEDLAETADVEPRYIQTLESGTANPSAAILIKVAGALEAKVGALFRPASLPKRPAGRPRKTARARPRRGE